VNSSSSGSRREPRVRSRSTPSASPPIARKCSSASGTLARRHPPETQGSRRLRRRQLWAGVQGVPRGCPSKRDTSAPASSSANTNRKPSSHRGPIPITALRIDLLTGKQSVPSSSREQEGRWPCFAAWVNALENALPTTPRGRGRLAQGEALPRQDRGSLSEVQGFLKSKRVLAFPLDGTPTPSLN